jgi:hypothetical protein
MGCIHSNNKLGDGNLNELEFVEKGVTPCDASITAQHDDEGDHTFTDIKSDT